MNTILEILFGVSIFSGMSILLLSLISFFSSYTNFWPPKSEKTWQFKLFWTLFTLFIFPLFIFILLNFDQKNTNSTFFYIGLFFSLLGLGFGNIISLRLGVKNSAGIENGLETAGYYSYSRNPVYVATIVSLLGTMLAFPILEVICISSLWITIYILAPFAEEPWLAERYGNEYLRYKCEVRRFI